MDNIMKKNQVKYRKECDPKVYGENVEKKLQSIINSIGDQSTLFLMAVRDCIVNKKSQAEIATKYNISRSRIQWAMSGKKETTKKEASSINRKEREKHLKKTPPEV